MPHITTAMQWSRRRGLGDIVMESLLGRRDSITSDVSSVKTTFSSWSNCMAASYCKWPVIIAIVVVALILFSIVWCIIRCACCGMSCCCTCFRCLQCCDICGGCCDGKKDQPHKHLDDPYAPKPSQGYQAPAPMMGGALGVKEQPSYAQFEVGKNGLAVEPKTLSEDALPPMPSWETASKKRVLADDEKDAVELGELDPATGQKVPLMAGAVSPGGNSPSSPSEMSTRSPYGARPGQGVGDNGYMSATSADPYARNQNAYNANGRGYGGNPPQPGMGGPGRGYGVAMSPNDNGGQRRGFGSPPPQDGMGQGRGYGPPSPQDSYSDNAFNGAAAGGYGRPPNQQYNNSSRPYPPQPQRQYSSDSSRPLAPGRQYSDGSYGGDQYNNGPSQNRGPTRSPGPGRAISPPTNNSGFDFGTGPQQYSSRPSPPPQQMPYGPQGSRRSPPIQHGGGGYGGGYSGSTAPPSYASRSPPPVELGGQPVYQPYQSPNQGGRGPQQGYMPGGRGGREPQGWDPVNQPR